ncbi:Protein alcS [Neolecta irregularis DAH-3]|uniref:Protein alcS n=1 Tax=Neolecta irregularis (strain DAH-3) TaxID=1198029 RepID=A0A1U7LPE4_NEOID|nr:Protein alcS [Neolecta irregularis DAH-3]|eukprot:OLL24498.1 Protein alcS [Neolecta irregularis DAH-3]
METQSKKLEEPFIESNEITRAQSTITIPHEICDKMCTRPSQHELRNEQKKYANPNALGLIGLVLVLSPLSCVLMGLRGATIPAGLVGPMYGSGAFALILGGIMEFLTGNTFSLIVFISFGGLFISLGVTSNPSTSGQSSFGDDLGPLHASLGFYFLFWTLLGFLFLIASLKTNLIFCWIFLATDIAFALLSASYFTNAQGEADKAKSYQKAYFLMSSSVINR